MSENREVHIQDKRGTEGCPDLFVNIIMKTANTMATVSGNSHKKLSTLGLSKEEAISLNEQLTELIEKDAKENPVKKDFSGVVPDKEVKDGNAKHVEPNDKAKETVGTQELPKKEETKESREGQSSVS